MRVMLKISYDGTNYVGWQRQKNGVSVQEVIENSIEKLTGQKTSLTASGRTDSGVHALGQVAHFDTDSNVPAERFYLALNTILPDDIKITASSEVDKSFHSRYGAKRKTYEYSYYLSEVKIPVLERFATRESDLDMEKMREAAALLVGEHDFKCFLSTGSTVKTTVRTIYDLTVTKTDDVVKIRVSGNGFLYNMVRIIAGTLTAYSSGKFTLENIKTALLTGDRNLVGKTAPAKGLCLLNVEYA